MGVDDAEQPANNWATTTFASDPAVGGDLAKVDWAATALGTPDTWPQSLQTAVDILLSSRFAMWMAWGPDRTFFCNAAYRRDTLGRKYPWALGRPAGEVWAEIWDDVGPRIEHVLATGEATWDEGLLLFLERSGYPEESYHTFSYSPLRDDGGQVVGMLCVVSEDTNRVIAERRIATLRDLGSDPSLSRSEEETLAFAALQLGGNTRDLPFTLTYLLTADGSARLAATSGIDRGHRAAPLVFPADGADVWPAEQPARGVTVVVDLDPARFGDLPAGAWPEPPTRALVVPIPQRGGVPCGFLVAALNRYRPLDDEYRGFVTLVAGHLAAAIASVRSYQAQQRRAAELAELDRAKTTFFANISHEFRTPLGLILGPVAELRAHPAGIDEHTRGELDLVHRNAMRLNKLVTALLDFSRIEAGRMQAHYEPVDIAAVTAELASVFRSAIERAGLTFTVNCPPLGEPVHLDRDMWEKVILNLLSNALKYTFTGSVSLVCARDGDDAVITVSDTGIGVPADEMPRLFERFYRVETARARSIEGSGIGLALVRELVGMHGGSIAADSTEGRGSAFTVRLPFGTAHLPAERHDATAGTRDIARIADPYVTEALQWLPDDGVAGPTGGAAGSAAGARVLVVDDNADMREYLDRLLCAAGYRVDTVADGVLALQAARADLPDLVISDVMMPGMDGFELLAALRSDPRTAALPVLLLSARAGQDDSIEGLRAGADDYLAKPFAAADLVARVRANIELARMRGHHTRWRAALIDSLQEAFFVCDEHGAVVEINAAFTDILGYGADGLPYPPAAPWWPDATEDPEAHSLIVAAHDELLSRPRGTFTIPVSHRDGPRLWITISFSHAADPDTGGRVIVGTFRDTTDEHYVVQRTTALAAVNQQLAQADTVEDALRAAGTALRHLWHARRVVATTFPARDQTAGAAARPPELVVVGPPAHWADLPERSRRIIEASRDGGLLTPQQDETGVVGIALRHPRGVVVVSIELEDRHPFTPADHELLTVLAGRLDQGLQRVHQLDQQRETALALQHAILGPARLPDGFEVRYQPATRPLQVGGDWYDVVELDDGRIALVVGDCVGHGLVAASVMGQLRSACRALLLEHPSPRAALEGLDRFAARLPGAQCTTALCAVLDPETGELVYSTAGHPPPILVHADHTTQMLDEVRAVPLGLTPQPSRAEARVTMPPRATLLLYTDGLVERRRQSLDDGIARAAGLVEGGGARVLDDLASEIMTRLVPGGGYQDDVALLLYRQPPPLEVRISADAGHLAATRAALRSWLTRAGIDTEQAYDVLIAAGEALANAIEHGHRDEPDGAITLHATALVDQLRLTISDCGSWKTPRTDTGLHRGRGVTLMRALMNDVSFHSDAAGTTVRLSASVTR